MKLDLAILNVLTGANRAIAASVIRGFLPAFTDTHATLADITAALGRLEASGHVTGTFSEDRGTLWKETADGRLRVANSK